MIKFILPIALRAGYSEIQIVINDDDPYALDHLEENAALTPLDPNLSSICEDPKTGEETNQQCVKGKCCPMEEEGRFGCCPYPNGMCCPNVGRCCKGGYKCVSPGFAEFMKSTFGETISHRFHCVIDLESFHFSDLWSGPPPTKNNTH